MKWKKVLDMKKISKILVALATTLLLIPFAAHAAPFQFPDQETLAVFKAEASLPFAGYDGSFTDVLSTLDRVVEPTLSSIIYSEEHRPKLALY